MTNPTDRRTMIRLLLAAGPAAALASAGCGGPSVEATPAAIAGPPPRRPNDDLMKPKGKPNRAARR